MMNMLKGLFNRKKAHINTDNIFNSIRINALVEQLSDIGAIDKTEYEKNVTEKIYKLINGGK